MLVLSLKPLGKITMTTASGERIEVTNNEKRRISVAIAAPESVKVLRGEVLEREAA